MAFGILMLLSTLRFIAKGWVYTMYIKPKLFFPYYGFEWIKPLEGNLMYVVFGILAIAALCIALGLFYRASAILFFLVFTYVELIDKTNYLSSKSDSLVFVINESSVGKLFAQKMVDYGGFHDTLYIYYNSYKKKEFYKILIKS